MASGTDRDRTGWVAALPALLRGLADAEDDGATLDICCRWLVDAAGATGAAFVDADASALGGAGDARLRLTPADRRWAVDRSSAEVRPCADRSIVGVPIAASGRRAGALVVCGPADAAGALADAARSVAALAGPAVDGRSAMRRVRQAEDARVPEILGASPVIRALRDAVIRAARSPFPVLIEGESGSGKELVARALHRLSARRERRLAAVNCAALTEDLADTELFGHARGAFTGAMAPRTGLVEDAHGGTLFLDEVAELSPRMQARLLRTLQEGEVRRVGENTARAVDVRIVSATNRSLQALAAQGMFREDLLFRLAVIRLRVPPLRERGEDVPLLVRHCWARAIQGVDTRASLGADAALRLSRHGWPGNVRELQNVMAGLAVAAPPRGRVSARHVEDLLAHGGPTSPMALRSLEGARAEWERGVLAAALARHDGRRSAAARELGLTRQGLAKALKRLSLDSPSRTPRSVRGIA